MNRMLRRWAVAAFVVPVAAWGLGMVADRIAAHKGDDSPVVRGLRIARSIMQPRGSARSAAGSQH